jgi:hypothetical protein
LAFITKESLKKRHFSFLTIVTGTATISDLAEPFYPAFRPSLPQADVYEALLPTAITAGCAAPQPATQTLSDRSRNTSIFKTLYAKGLIVYLTYSLLSVKQKPFLDRNNSFPDYRTLFLKKVKIPSQTQFQVNPIPSFDEGITSSTRIFIKKSLVWDTKIMLKKKDVLTTGQVAQI